MPLENVFGELALDATVESLRDALIAAIASATDEEVRDTVTGFRTAFAARDLATSVRQDELLAELRLKPNAGQTVQVRPTLEQRQLAGYGFWASSGRVTVTTAGNFRATFRVPTSSRWAHLQRLALFCSSGPVYGELLVNPTDGLPASDARPVNNLRVGTPIASSVELRADTHASALGGGIDTGLVLALPGGQSTVLELAPLSIPPNVTVGLNIPFVGPSDVVMTGYWYEEN